MVPEIPNCRCGHGREIETISNVERQNTRRACEAAGERTDPGQQEEGSDDAGEDFLPRRRVEALSALVADESN
jgi:LmbE family N-acetylglucosaminyl deacetylase